MLAQFAKSKIIFASKGRKMLTLEEKCLLSPATQAKIVHYENRCKNYERILRRIRQNIFDYDTEKEEKAHRVIAKIKRICEPAWQRQRSIASRKREDRLLFRTA